MKDSKTNHVYFSTYFTEPETHCAAAVKKALRSNGIPYSDIKGTKDIWARDYMPIQIAPKTFVCYKYRPDYLLQKAEDEQYITDKFCSAESILAIPEKNRCPIFYEEGVELRNCDLILDGGNIVLCGDKLILTEKAIRENSDKTEEEVTDELKRAFRAETVIFIPVDPYEKEDCETKNKNRTDGRIDLPLCHADGVVAPIDDENILIADYGKDELGYVAKLRKALLKHFKEENIHQLNLGDRCTVNSWVYINFLRVGDVVLVPALGGDESGADSRAEEQLRKILGVEKVIPINTRFLSLGIDEKDTKVKNDNCGGALHCVSWNVFA